MFTPPSWAWDGPAAPGSVAGWPGPARGRWRRGAKRGKTQVGRQGAAVQQRRPTGRPLRQPNCSLFSFLLLARGAPFFPSAHLIWSVTSPPAPAAPAAPSPLEAERSCEKRSCGRLGGASIRTSGGARTNKRKFNQPRPNGSATPRRRVAGRIYHHHGDGALFRGGQGEWCRWATNSCAETWSTAGRSICLPVVLFPVRRDCRARARLARACIAIIPMFGTRLASPRTKTPAC